VTELVDTEPSYFQEVVKKQVWVDKMMEECKSIIKNSVREVVPRQAYKSVVGSRWASR